jgi:predicted short-subunit dehydrogenase-like oxidoreductase (DUF2520 family)
MKSAYLKDRLKIGIVGTGNVATHLSLYFRYKGFTISAIAGRTRPSAKKLARQLKCQDYSDTLYVLEKTNLILLAVPDPVIPLLTGTLSQITFQEPVVYLAHTSGSQLSSVLDPVKTNKTTKLHLAAFHPMQTFPDPAKSNPNYYRSIKKIYFGIEGESPAVKMLCKLTTELRNNYIILPTDSRKGLYHIGGIITSNFLTALFYQVTELYSTMSLSEKNTLKILRPLIEQTLNNIEQYGSFKALTGPAARNDLETLNKHIFLLKNAKPNLIPSYKALSELCRQMRLKNTDMK